MAIKADFHTHTHFSSDSDTPMESTILSAIEKGLSHLCITEHVDFDFPLPEEMTSTEESTGYFQVNTDSYLYDLIQYKEKYADSIKLLFGIELGMQAHLSRRQAAYIKSYDFDFVIGSSHLANGKNPYNLDFFEGRSERDAFEEYFSSIKDNINSFSNYDVYGHLDYVVRYGPNTNKNYSYQAYRDILDEILKLLIKNEKGIEINMGGLRTKANDTNPTLDIVKRYKELGGEIITVGSDAHVAKDVAYKFDMATDILKTCGFDHYTVFEKRFPEFIKI